MQKITDLEKIINKQLKELDIKSLVEKEIRESIKGDIKQEVLRAVKTRVDELVNDEIEITLDEPVEVDDGWSNKASYDSFRDLFKKIFKKKLDESWEMKRLIENKIRERVDQLVSEKQKAIASRITEELLKNEK